MVYFKLKKGELTKLITNAIKKSGSERKLSKDINISKGTIYSLKNEKRNISDIYLEKIRDYLEIKNFNDNIIIEKYENNWGQKKGGKETVHKKISEGTLKDNISKMNKASSLKMKKWYKYMKENETERYYKWQYERFKKVGRGYNHTLNNGIKVRNPLEKEIGDFLIENFKGIEYEKYFNFKGKAYFPDFTIKQKIIEVTEWKHPSKEKIRRLIRKINDFESNNYEIKFYIPSQYRKFYKELEKSLISTLTEVRHFLSPHSSGENTQKVFRSNR